MGQFIADQRLWSPGHRVVVGVSGGLDSMCLLDLLVCTADWHGAALEVATVNHGTRPGSHDDACFVAERCAGLGLRCHTFEFELGPSASEAVCREARYTALRTLQADRIAVAHHLDDQAETAVLMLLRGTGLRGLSAMSPRENDLVRPLLDIPRVELERWAAHRSLDWRVDPSNQDPRFARNRVRGEVMPLLESIRSGAAKTLARSTVALKNDADYLDALASERPGPPWSTSWVAEAPVSLVDRCIRRACGADRRHVAAIRAAALKGKGRVLLPEGTEVVVSAGWVVIVGA